ncbi:hypothetical protein MKW92_047365 [Papaver armeniacum]|nr:hypothetical protein MKW92_047365 [Papaver armeniacum]
MLDRWYEPRNSEQSDDAGMFSVILKNGTAADNGLVCYETSKVTSSGIWQGDNPLNYALPLFILQLVLVVFVTRLFVVILKPFRQPRRTGKKSLVVAVAGIGLPFLIAGASSYKLLHGSGRHMTKDDYLKTGTFILFFARILAELKHLTTELGRLAVSSAIVNDMLAWIILALAIAISENKHVPLGKNGHTTHRDVKFGAVYVMLFKCCHCGFIKTPEGECVSEFYICLILTGVMFCGFVTDSIGTHSIFGAFMFGLVIPNGSLASNLIEKLEVLSITHSSQSAWLLDFEMPTSEAIALGLLMNTKGLNEINVLNPGRDQKPFALMVIVAVVTTAILIPTVTAVYSAGGRFVPNKRRTIQKSKPDAECRIKISHNTFKNIPYLVELTGRASDMLIVHNTRKSGRPAMNRTQAESNQILNAFENYEENAAFVTVQSLTAMSPYSTMHEDICNLAEDKRVSIVIIPFHKQQTIDGRMEEPNPAFRTVNHNVISNSRCSVGILVDRGLGASARTTNSNGGVDTKYHTPIKYAK